MSSPGAPLKRQDLIALNMLDLSMPVPDAASARVNSLALRKMKKALDRKPRLWFALYINQSFTGETNR
jgi:hypothetical protein